LALHNAKRAIHNTPNLTWNQTLADYAQTYGSKCVFAHSKGPYGENLAVGSPASSWSSADLFQLWYDEGKGYDYSTTTFNSATGHFTQLVWKNSKQLGCAIVTCD
ncbi:PR-1-like protein, partial [Jaminaea rosea]